MAAWAAPLAHGASAAGAAPTVATNKAVTATEAQWLTSFEDAKAQALARHVPILADFSGSDWCGWCIKLHNEVFDKEPFKAEAPKQFVLVELDFRRFNASAF